MASVGTTHWILWVDSIEGGFFPLPGVCANYNVLLLILLLDSLLKLLIYYYLLLLLTLQ